MPLAEADRVTDCPVLAEEGALKDTEPEAVCGYEVGAVPLETRTPWVLDLAS